MKRENNYILIALIGAILIFYFNTFTWLIESWLYNEYYSHGFLIPIVSGYIVWKMRQEIFSIPRKQANEGLIIFIASIGIQIVSTMNTIRFLSGFSLLLTMAGIIIYIYGWNIMNKIKFPFLFLLLMIPVPFIDYIAAPTQQISTVFAASLANIIGLPVQRNGLILDMPSGSFEVGIECSGINSIISLLTIGIIFAFILEGSRTMKTTLLVSTVPLALTGNIIRIASILLVADKYGKDAALDYFHDFSSLLLFSIALIGLFLVGRSFGRLRFKKMF